MPVFDVGDYVRIVDEPDWNCDVGWDEGMTQYCGQTARVASVGRRTVRLDIDNRRFVWNAQIIQLIKPPCELPDLDPVPPEALQILFGCGGEG